jgi:hypothetical protein
MSTTQPTQQVKKLTTKKATATTADTTQVAVSQVSHATTATPVATQSKKSAKKPTTVTTTATTNTPAVSQVSHVTPVVSQTKKSAKNVSQVSQVNEVSNVSPKKSVVVETRVPNTKPSSIDYSGIGIGPSKAKNVLSYASFNSDVYKTRKAIIAAENKPFRPKPTAMKPDPEMPAQGEQTPISNLSKEFLDVINAAEQAHLQNLTSEYEKSVIKSLSSEQQDLYKKGLKEKMITMLSEDDREVYIKNNKDSMLTSLSNQEMRDYNLSFSSTFYDNFDNYCKENDSYAIGRVIKDKDGKEHERFNQWTRAMALVNKSCIRLSNKVREVLACFLDNLVLQYAHNGIVNCVNEGHSNLQLRHALNVTEGFNSRVSLDPFARTLYSYQAGLNWVETCKSLRDVSRRNTTVTASATTATTTEQDTQVVNKMPEYPKAKTEENFEGYVVDICRSLRVRLADKQTDTVEKNKYHNIKISENFKQFCSDIIHESICRIGSHLKETVSLKSVKTVNESLIYYSLRQLCNVCGIDYEPIGSDMETRLAKFTKYCEARRESRRNKRGTSDDGDSDADADVDADSDTDADENAVEY